MGVIREGANLGVPMVWKHNESNQYLGIVVR